MLKMKINLSVECQGAYSQVAIPYFVLKNDKSNYWLLPFKKDLILVKPEVKRGKVKTELSNESGILDQKIYDITDWMNDDDIDETIEELIRGVRLKKLDSETVNGVIIIGGEINTGTGKTALTFDATLNHGLSITSYGLTGYRTNHAA